MPQGKDNHIIPYLQAAQVILSGLSIDVGEAELMRFFSKQGPRLESPKQINAQWP